MSENLELDELSESAGMDDEPVLKKDSLDDNFDIPSSASDLEAVYDIPVKVSARRLTSMSTIIWWPVAKSSSLTTNWVLP